MDNSALLQKVVTELNVIENIYDSIRLIEPVEKRVYSYMKSDCEDLSQACYGFWGKDLPCENCISMRAFNLKRTFVKIEYTDSRVYMITSVPFNCDSGLMVIELIKDITNDGIIYVQGMEFSEVRKLIGQRNIAIIRDALTRIYNEQYIHERLPHDILKANENNINIALFLIKIKNMEVINGNYGYNAGDHVIKEIAGVIRNFPRKRSDWVSRYRNTEFILIMQDVEENQVQRICKRINDRISRLDFTFEGDSIDIEISIGYHVVKNEIIIPEQFIEKADKKLYPVNKLMKDESAENYNEGLLQNSSLTLREKEVALLLLMGKSNIEIAEVLYVGLSTVKKHVSAIFNKTDVKSRAEFLARMSKR